MTHFDSQFLAKLAPNFYCEKCAYTTSRKNDFAKHLLTPKHLNDPFDAKMTPYIAEPRIKSFTCQCGKQYNCRSTLYRHRKICLHNAAPITPDLIMELIKTNHDMKQIILDQNATITDLVQHSIAATTTTNNNTNTNTNNSHNNTFNLQVFLNETCKDAMNISDFIDSIKLQLSDLEKVGELGYVQGISNIITSNLKAMDVSLRPVHCTDKKRETMYVKDDNKWEKEDDNNSRLRKAIKRIANKNIRLLPQFREKNPQYNNSSLHISDKYDKMVLEAMGGAGNDDIAKENKIINDISKCVTLKK